MGCPEKRWNKCPGPSKCPFWEKETKKCFYAEPSAEEKIDER
jgi:hypothetical protein